ncbi:hypothetical protein AVEN_82446-1 [Araneus ventricosus]|uniref:Uncharacterized protein n=1 Tax=Araneus ventricosus TaxID=182803 RepID=A0A4Y2HT27_ARAVE|nr:hypothetical protein AVEN_82446-1 [Araneus ventricosus]
MSVDASDATTLASSFVLEWLDYTPFYVRKMIRKDTVKLKPIILQLNKNRDFSRMIRLHGYFSSMSACRPRPGRRQEDDRNSPPNILGTKGPTSY